VLRQGARLDLAYLRDTPSVIELVDLLDRVLAP
jgi:hypothetical protein